MEGAGRAKDLPSRISIERAKNGGFVVNHSFDNMDRGESYRPPETHAFTSRRSMMTHLRKHLHPGTDTDGDDDVPTGVSRPAAPPAHPSGKGLD
jgi:hypothetical protein